MIVTLMGNVAEKLGDVVVLDVRGVGYGLLVSVDDFSRLLVGDSVKLYVYEHIRENSHDLFGFIKLDTKNLFEQLLGVSGVGPKMALSILGLGSTEKVRQAIAAGDTKFIQAASGVGKRVAERVVVELKDKVGLVSTASDDILFISSTQAEKDEAVQGLVALGYSLADAVSALHAVDKGLKTEERIKQALKGSAL
jgi:Holliday junction DNA helicase RuvA